jgi:hypothetical protein
MGLTLYDDDATLDEQLDYARELLATCAEAINDGMDPTQSGAI